MSKLTMTITARRGCCRGEQCGRKAGAAACRCRKNASGFPRPMECGCIRSHECAVFIAAWIWLPQRECLYMPSVAAWWSLRAASAATARW